MSQTKEKLITYIIVMTEEKTNKTNLTISNHYMNC
jgi:hypothetical protein